MGTLYKSIHRQLVGRRARSSLGVFVAVLMLVVQSQQAIAQWSHDPNINTTISTAANFQNYPTIVSDGAGGAIITWQDYRSGTNSDIYAQRVNSSGAVQWTADGVAISTAADYQYYPTIVSDGAGGAIITWQDLRSGPNSDIYTQNIDRFGYLGDASAHIVKVKDIINDQGSKVTIMWKPSYLDALSDQLVTSYNIYRGVKPTAVSSGSAVLSPEEYDNIKLDGERKVYLKLPLSKNSTDTIYWENIGHVNAELLEGYSFNAMTLSDSGPQGIPWYYFMVRAKTFSSAFWNSNVDSSYSVDNLPPAAVPSLAAQLQAGPSVKLYWPADRIDPDVGYYEAHRSTTSGFTPSQATKIGISADSMFVDASPVGGTENFYRVITLDVHGNRSLPSPQTSVTVTGVDEAHSLPTEYALGQNFPNPFNPMTAIKYVIPEEVNVRLIVSDVLGREVAALVDELKPANRYEVNFDASNLPSGMYFYKLQAGKFLDVKKMILMR